MLCPIEWRDNWGSLTRLAAEIERHLGIIEPEAEMILDGFVVYLTLMRKVPIFMAVKQ